MSIKKTELLEGVNLYLIPDLKFKNFRLSVFIHTPLKKETATKNALLPIVLNSGSKNFPEKRDINLELEKLYGARIGGDVEKKGESHIINFGLDLISDKYLEGASVQEDAFKLFEDILLNPLAYDGQFSDRVVNREKETLKNEIEGVINDKRSYALVRCVEEMCSDEAYGVRQYGKSQDLDPINSKNLYEHYINVINNSPMDFVVSGNFDEEKITSTLGEMVKKLKPRKPNYPETVIKSDVSDIKDVKEKSDILQGKLVLGFRTGVLPESEDYYKLMVYNAIYGSGTSSKLFNNVREKMSLCYYASSMIDRKKGLMLAQAGIDYENYKKALDEIIKQGEEIKIGKFTKEEFDNAVAGIINNLLSYKDDLGLISAYYGAQTGYKTVTSIDEAVQKIKEVNMEQIKSIARQIKVDTIYFLHGNGAEEK